MEMRQYDRAWCVGGGAGVPAQGRRRGAAVLRAVQAEGLRARQARASPRSCGKNIYHPDEDRYISHIFAAVSQAVAAARAKEHKDWGLKRKDKRDVADRPAAVQQGVQLRQPGAGRAAAGALPAARVAGRAGPGQRAREGAADRRRSSSASSLLQGRPEKELAYVIGKKLTLMRPDHFVRWPTVVPTVAELKVVFLAALKLVQPKLRGEGRPRAAGRRSTCDAAAASWCRRR